MIYLNKNFLMDIVHKMWKASTPPLKKLFAKTITHQLSRNLDKKNFEVVFEGFLDSQIQSIEQPDVVIYSKLHGLAPLVAIEICQKEEVPEMMIIGKRLTETYSLKEFFIFDNGSDIWYRIDRNGNESINSMSAFLSLDLKNMTNTTQLIAAS
jgi:hypothetical protein